MTKALVNRDTDTCEVNEYLFNVFRSVFSFFTLAFYAQISPNIHNQTGIVVTWRVL